MEPFFYLRPKSLDEALMFLQRYGDRAKIIAGGTDLIVKMKKGLSCPKYLIDLTHISTRDNGGLEYIVPQDGGVRIGGMTTHRALENSFLIKEKFSALADAVENIGSVQIRHVATIAGNVCTAAPSADTAPPLLVLGAAVRIKGPGNEEVIALEEFFLGPGKTILKADEILVEFILPPPLPHTGSAYWKHTRRQSMELPMVGVALSLTVDKGELPNSRRLFMDSASAEKGLQFLDDSGLICRDARIALGVAGPTPIRAKGAEGVLKGERLTEGKIDTAGKVASQEATPRDTWRGKAWYRREMIHVLTKRLAVKCLERIFLEEKT